jgi:hypothetical protein
MLESASLKTRENVLRRIKMLQISRIVYFLDRPLLFYF